MAETKQPAIAIVDLGMGNLLSVKLACEHVGLNAEITSSYRQIRAAEGVILPGVGAFGYAMESLRGLDLVEALQEYARAGKPLIGICLGMQLLFDEGVEFGRCLGLGLIRGEVVKFDAPADSRGTLLKVPNIGWNEIYRSGPPGANDVIDSDPWQDTPLSGMADGVSMYFNHSFHVKPVEPQDVLSNSRYGTVEFCSSVRKANILGFQFHPERSGPCGLQIYRKIAEWITKRSSIAH